MNPVAARPVRSVVTRETILRHAHDLPAAPQVLGGLCELLEDVNTDLDQIAEQIRVDPALGARVLRLSNSVAFGGGTKVGSIDEAVLRVGFAEITRLVGLATVAGLVDRALSAYGVAAEKLRESLLLHALASEALAGYTTVDPRMAYTAGLLRGVGMMVLDRAARGALAESDVFNADSFGSYDEWERARFGRTSVEVTTMVLDDWRFPAELVLAVQQHLQPETFDDGDQAACVLNLAGAIVTQGNLALPGDAFAWTLTAEKLSAAGLDEEQFADAAAQARRVFERQRSALY